MNSSSTIKILFLASDPSNVRRLRLGEELRNIKEILQKGRAASKYQLEQKEAVRVDDITQAIFDFEPQIVHFSVHGTSQGELYFEDELGTAKPVEAVAFAFAGLHTLEEMTADYFQPFFASVIPIHVAFIERAATRQILANPVELSDVETHYQSSDVQEDFPLDYTPEALDKIYDLTHGQPYLVQLIGFQLVRRYNDQVFEMGRKRDPVFTVEEVEAVVNDPQFFKRGRYYFDGVWSQAAQGASGQQMILQILAPHSEGLNCREVAYYISSRDIDEKNLQAALNTLKRHDVIQETDGRWYIIVELFRRWVLQLQHK